MIRDGGYTQGSTVGRAPEATSPSRRPARAVTSQTSERRQTLRPQQHPGCQSQQGDEDFEELEWINYHWVRERARERRRGGATMTDAALASRVFLALHRPINDAFATEADGCE